MFGGLHLEMGMWTMPGNYLACSGWTAALTEVGIATAGKADSFLKATHLARTHHAHQNTCVALEKLQKEAFEAAKSENRFEEWRHDMIKKSLTFQYWHTILSLALLILTFIRAHREKNFPLYVEALEAIVGYLFAFDHYNYACWVPTHIRDMLSLPDSIKQNFMRYWVVSKTKNRFSSIPIDQMHEQENAKVKGIGGVIGLTKNPIALRHWMMCGTELARCISQFENQMLSVSTDPQKCLYHEEGLAVQKSFK